MVKPRHRSRGADVPQTETTTSAPRSRTRARSDAPIPALSSKLDAMVVKVNATAIVGSESG